MARCLDDYSWHSLKGYGSMAPLVFEAGDYKNVVLKDGTPAQFRIIGRNHDEAEDGTILPLTWELVDCLPEYYRMNQRDTNQGNWGASDLCHQMNDAGGRIYRLIPDDIIAVAEPVVKLTAEAYDGTNTITRSVNKFFVTSEKEVFGRNIYSAPGEGKWYEYYRMEDVPWYKLCNGERTSRCLRSPIAGGSYGFCGVSGTGAAGYSRASYSCGVSFGFSF